MPSSFLRFVFFALLCVSTFGFGQTYVKKDLVTDLQFMDSVFRYGHPVNQIKTQTLSFSESISRVTSRLPDTLNKLQYENAVREVLMDVKCGHTQTIGWPTPKVKKPIVPKLFPYFVFSDGEKLWISQKVNDSVPSLLQRGDEIISINGNKADSMVPILKNYHPQDGVGNELSNQIINEYFPQLYAKCFDKDSIFNVVYKDAQGVLQTTILNGYKFEMKKENDKDVDVQGNEAYMSLLNDTIAYVRIKSIKAKEQEFYDRVFQRIQDRKINYLIVDLRNNGGGNLYSSADFVSYLSPDTCSFSITLAKKNIRRFLSWKHKNLSRLNTMIWKVSKKFDREKTEEGNVFTGHIYPKHDLVFKGKIFVLVNGFTGSGASFISAYARHHGNAILLGQKTGGGEYWNSAGTYPPIELPKSGIRILSPTMHMRADFPAQHFNGIEPDYQLKYDAESYGVRDLEMETVFELMGNK